jgi:hypothetical protein
VSAGSACLSAGFAALQLGKMPRFGVLFGHKKIRLRKDGRQTKARAMQIARAFPFAPRVPGWPVWAVITATYTGYHNNKEDSMLPPIYSWNCLLQLSWNWINPLPQGCGFFFACN